MAKGKTPGPTQQERALADRSEAQWLDYVERFRPAEVELIKRAQFTKGERASVEGQAATDAAAAFKGTTRASHAGAGSKQIGSGRSKMSLAADANALGQARGLARGMAATGGELDSEQQKVKIAAMGRGIAHEATANMARGAQRATNLSLASADARFQSNLAKRELIATVAGAATRKYGKKLFKGDRVEDTTADLNQRVLDDNTINLKTNPFAGMFGDI